MFSHCNLSLYGGHKDEINCLVFSRDFEILLTGSINGCIRIWNTIHNHLTFKINEQKGRIRVLDISKNDKYFASTANDIFIRLYETRTGDLIHLLSGHTHPSDCLHFSSDNRFIASGAWDCRTILWNVITGEEVYNFQHHTNAVQSIAFHSNRNLMATGSHDHKIFLYNLDQHLQSQPVVLQGHYNNIRALAFSSSPYFASAGWDKIIIIWCMKNMRIRSRLLGHTGWIQSISFRDDDGSILGSVDDDMVCVWNIVNGICLYQLPILNDLSCSIRFLPNNGGLLIGGTVYELLVNLPISSRERRRIQYVHESITGESKLMSILNNRNIKLPKLKSKRV